MRIGAFEILEQAGAGGMGTVWEGRHSPTNLPVAVKFLTAERAQNPMHAAAFEAEARAIARLNHPRVVRVYDVGRLPDDAGPTEVETGSPYIVMEWAPQSLEDLPRPLAWETARAAALEVLDALAQVHARGIVHRDIKPSNVLGRLGRLRLGDFGIALLRDEQDAAGSSASGTPYFMAPEQFTGSAGQVGPSTDLYAVGCLVYLLATGDYPFQGTSVVELARQHLQDTLPVEGMHPELAVWLRRMTAKRPEQRYRFAAGAATDLARIDQVFASSSGAPTERWLSPKTMATETLPMTTIVLEPTNMPSTEPLWQEDAQRPAPVRALPHWRGPEGFRDHVEHLHGAGIRLSALRMPPFVGRESERDVLWGALKEVVELRRPRIAAVTGPAGIGKTRIARWLGERGHELGAARMIVSRPGGAFLVDIIREKLGARDRDELAARIDARGSALSRTERNALVRLLSDDFEARSDEERRRLLLLGLRLIADGAALVVLIEDVDRRDAEAVEFAHYVRRMKGTRPFLVVLTSRNPIPDPRGRLTSVELSRLSDVDISRIIGDRMRLHPDLAVRIVERADGNPHDAVSIVTSLIAEGRLRTTEHGYGLSDDRPLAADSDDEGFAEIVSNVFLHFGRDGRDALELAAALGDRLSRREWRLIAGEAHTSIAPGLETALETRGVIQTDADGFRFVSRGFRRRVIAESRERNDWRSRVAVCRSALSEDGTPRAAQWDFDVGAYLSAANTWLGLADQAARKSEVHAALQMLRRAGEAASKLSGEGIERLQTEIDVRKAELWARERIEDAESMASRVEQQARRHGWDELLARALLARASYARKRVALDEARSLYREARDLHERLGNTRELAVCMQGLGMCAVASGDLDAAEHHYDLALGHALPARDLAAAAWCANGLGDVYRKQGELAVAQSWYERALNWFDTVGDTYGAMWCVHDLAQTKRARGELGAAEADYERTIRIARQLGQRVVAPRLNLGIVRVQRGDYDGARSAFEEVLEESRARDIPGEEGIARICLLPCEATAGRWEEVARQLRKGRELIGTLVDQDLGQMAAIASEIARDAGRDDIATQLAEFARAQA